MSILINIHTPTVGLGLSYLPTLLVFLAFLSYLRSPIKSLDACSYASTVISSYGPSYTIATAVHHLDSYSSFLPKTSSYAAPPEIPGRFASHTCILGCLNLGCPHLLLRFLLHVMIRFWHGLLWTLGSIWDLNRWVVLLCLLGIFHCSAVISLRSQLLYNAEVIGGIERYRLGRDAYKHDIPDDLGVGAQAPKPRPSTR